MWSRSRKQSHAVDNHSHSIPIVVLVEETHSVRYSVDNIGSCELSLALYHPFMGALIPKSSKFKELFNWNRALYAPTLQLSSSSFEVENNLAQIMLIGTRILRIKTTTGASLIATVVIPTRITRVRIRITTGIAVAITGTTGIGTVIRTRVTAIRSTSKISDRSGRNTVLCVLRHHGLLIKLDRQYRRVIHRLGRSR